MISRILLAVLALAYTLSPYDFVPDFAIGWGWIDDLIVLWLLWQFFKKQSSYQSDDDRSRASQDKQYAKKEPGAEEPFAESAGPKDPYTVLDIDQNASPQEIKTAYRKLANKYHPDKVQHLGEEFRKLAERRFKEIEEAYRVLTSKK